MLRLSRNIAHFKRFSTKIALVIRSVEELSVQRSLKVTWSDGKIGVFPFVWLRDSSPDEETFHLTNSLKARNLLMKNLDLQIVPTKVSVDSEESLEISWPDGVQSSYKSDWLRFRNPSDAEQRRIRKRAYFQQFQTWGATELQEQLREFKFEEIQTDKKKLHDCLLELCQKGVVLVKTSGEKQLVRGLANLVGYPYHTHFGTFWDVEIKENPTNLAYTTNEIGLHTDEPALPTTPQVIIFHMIRNVQSEGGETLLADGFRVAELLKLEKPEIFDLLTRVPLEFLDEGSQPDYAWDLCSRHKVLELDEEGGPNRCFFSSHQRSWYFDLEPEKMVEMYQALKIFNDYCYQDRNLWKKKLKNGEMLICANDRILHGRSGYKDGRLLLYVGCGSLENSTPERRTRVA